MSVHTLYDPQYADASALHPCGFITSQFQSTCCCNSLHPSGFRLPTRVWNLAAGICSLSATRALVSLGLRTGSQSALQFLPKVSPKTWWRAKEVSLKMHLTNKCLCSWRKKKKGMKPSNRYKKANFCSCSFTHERLRFAFLGHVWRFKSSLFCIYYRLTKPCTWEVKPHFGLCRPP